MLPGSRSPGLGDLDDLSCLADDLRRRLYEHVCEVGRPVARDEAAAALGIGRTLAAYHLDKLVEHGLLVVSQQRRSGRSGPGAGRPAKLYSRAERDFSVSTPPRDYELAARLLAEAAERDPEGALSGSLREVARERGRTAGASRRPGGGRGTRRELERALHDQGYGPFEDGDGVLRLCNCPFHSLAQEHTATICGMNHALVEGLIDGLGASDLSAELEPRPGCCCVAVHERRPRR